MADDCGETSQNAEQESEFRRQRHPSQHQPGQAGGGQCTLAQVDQNHGQGKPPTQRAQGIGAARVAGAHGADVHAAEAAQYQTAGNRTQQIATQYAEQQRQPDHVERSSGGVQGCRPMSSAPGPA